MRIPILILIALLPFTTSWAQEMKSSESEESMTEEEAPQKTHRLSDGWEVRLDKPDSEAKVGAGDDADVVFVDAMPGWDVTTHKSAIFYDPEVAAEGDFTAKADILLFDPGDRDREAFGIFVGGKNLDADNQEYTYFLLRNTGDFLIKRRTGSETSVLVDWTHTDAMKVHPHDDTESVLNEMAVHPEDDTVHFLVNGTEVAALPREDAPVDGIVGLRVNHGLNLHVSSLSAGM